MSGSTRSLDQVAGASAPLVQRSPFGDAENMMERTGTKGGIG